MANSTAILEEEVLSELLPYLNTELQKMAASSGWPSNVYTQLSVTAENGQLGVSYPDSLDKKVEDLEYGTQGQPPRSVLRAFTNRYTHESNKRLSDIAIWMFMEGEV